MLLAILMGTLLDIYFVGQKIYAFPIRPFPELFSFNIGFTFVVLPAGVVIFLYVMELVNGWGKAGVVLFLSLLGPIMERLAEVFGLFAHTNEWQHLYTFFGYLLFLTILYGFYLWIEKRRRG
jgi:hypothetical protein